MQYLLSSSLFAGFQSLTTDLGAAPERLLQQFNIPADISEQADEYVDFGNAIRLFEYCAKTLDCPDFGLQLSQRQGLSILGPVAVLARSANTVGDAIKGIADYLHLLSPAVSLSIKMLPASDCIRIVFTILDTSLVHTRQLFELSAGNGQLIIQMLTGRNLVAKKIYFPHSMLAPKAAYKNLFKCDVAFQQDVCAMELPMAVMQHKLANADDETAHIATAYLAEHYGDRSFDLSEQVSLLITRLLPTGHCKIDTVAEQLGMHRRTLQRRLGEKQQHFEAMVDEHRKALATRYLVGSDMQLSQVAGLLGYADQSVLNRSCRRWFNAKPKDLRRKM